MDEKRQIIDIFNKKVKGKKPISDSISPKHDGQHGHWLERAMGIAANGRNEPDLLGFEMKAQTNSKTTFGDWSANYYIFRDKKIKLSRSDFLRIFGKANPNKKNRYSWSGEPVPSKFGKITKFGQYIEINQMNDISIIYNFSKDTRIQKETLVPQYLQDEHLLLARWDNQSIKRKLENKFNQKGFFKCLQNKNGEYDRLVFGPPIDFETWIKYIKNGEVFFDSGMYDGNSRNYSQWRANNSFWDKLLGD